MECEKQQNDFIHPPNNISLIVAMPTNYSSLIHSTAITCNYHWRGGNYWKVVTILQVVIEDV